MPAILDPQMLQHEASLHDLVLPTEIWNMIAYELDQNAGTPGRTFRNTITITGAGGLGKTSLGLAIARQIGAAKVIMVTAKPDRKEIDRIKDEIEDDTFLLLDEIHAYAGQEWLLDTVYGARGLAKMGQRPPKFTVFAATTNRGKLPQTVMSRFPIQMRIEYTRDEIRQIGDMIAKRFNVELDDEGRKVLLNAANGNPRTMERVLGFWGCGDPGRAVQMSQLTPDGLDEDSIALLDYLGERRRALGREALARVLEAPGGIADIEAILLRRRYIQPDSRGQLEITSNGMKRLAIRAKEGI